MKVLERLWWGQVEGERIANAIKNLSYLKVISHINSGLELLLWEDYSVGYVKLIDCFFLFLLDIYMTKK